jgi:hypothetical protein
MIRRSRLLSNDVCASCSQKCWAVREHANVNTVATLQVNTLVAERSVHQDQWCYQPETTGVRVPASNQSSQHTAVGRDLLGEQAPVVTRCRNRSRGTTSLVEERRLQQVARRKQHLGRRSRWWCHREVLQCGVDAGQSGGTGVGVVTVATFRSSGNNTSIGNENNLTTGQER